MYYEHGKHHMVDAAELLVQVAKLRTLSFNELAKIWEGYHFLSSVIVADQQMRSETIH